MSWTWRHVLYRFHDSTGALLYVGITNNVTARFSHHAWVQPWWEEVAGCAVEFHPDRVSLEQAERDAIRTENPQHNVVRYMPPTPDPARERRLQRQADERDLDDIVDRLIEWCNPFVEPYPGATWLPHCPSDGVEHGALVGRWEPPEPPF